MIRNVKRESTRRTADPALDAAVAARLLRLVLTELPPSTPTDRATARRIEGAALALDALAKNAR